MSDLAISRKEYAQDVETEKYHRVKGEMNDLTQVPGGLRENGKEDGERRQEWRKTWLKGKM